MPPKRDPKRKELPKHAQTVPIRMLKGKVHHIAKICEEEVVPPTLGPSDEEIQLSPYG